MNKFRLYVDEVGNPDLGNSDNPNHRFLSLTGVIINLDYVKDALHPEMEALKAKYFGAHPAGDWPFGSGRGSAFLCTRVGLCGFFGEGIRVDRDF